MRVNSVPLNDWHNHQLFVHVLRKIFSAKIYKFYTCFSRMSKQIIALLTKIKCKTVYPIFLNLLSKSSI